MAMRTPVTLGFTIGSVAAIWIMFIERWPESINEATNCQQNNYSILRAQKPLKRKTTPIAFAHNEGRWPKSNRFHPA